MNTLFGKTAAAIAAIFATQLFVAYPVTAAVAQGADITIATVDMQAAIQAVDQGKKARGELETAFNKKKKELQKEEAEIKKMHEDLQKQSLVMNEQALQKKQAEIQQRIMKFQETTARSQMEIQKREQELTAPIVKKMRDVIAGLAKEKGYTIVLEKNENNVLYSLEKDDLTTEVIKKYNTAK